MKYFFCGIGGSGMSSIAGFLLSQGHCVVGSDRSFDQNIITPTLLSLQKKGISLFPQDGSGIDSSVDYVILSTAIEKQIPDVQRALQLGVKTIHRSELLASIFNSKDGIAISGTSGKTTITAIVGHILHFAELQPSMINGGVSINTYTQNDSSSSFISGKGNICVIEADESDGSIEMYQPDIALISNISLDHKPIVELIDLFSSFVKKAKTGVVLNKDCALMKPLFGLHKKTITFSKNKKTGADFIATDISFDNLGTYFSVNGEKGFMPLFGQHNVENALSAIAVCSLKGVSIADSLTALKTFWGTKRRLEKIGVAHDIAVFDDYAHNPEKISASLRTLHQGGHRLWVLYQPHGFAPTRLLKNDLIDAFVRELSNDDYVFFTDIFYVGGSVCSDISSKDLVDGIQQKGKKAFYIPNRTQLFNYLSHCIKGDRIVVMGARDASLSDFAKEIVVFLQEKIK